MNRRDFLITAAALAASGSVGMAPQQPVWRVIPIYDVQGNLVDTFTYRAEGQRVPLPILLLGG